MCRLFFRKLTRPLVLMAVGWALFHAPRADADPQHGLALYGAPALPPDVVLPYANPQAPKGGRLVEGNTGGFDSLNPFILKGTAPWQLARLTHESLMLRSADEPFTLYCLLCESVDVAADQRSVTFTLRAQARFSDRSPVTVDDVIWSFQTLGTQGHPRYRAFHDAVAAITQTGPRSVTLHFARADRELPLLAGLRPILQRAEWQGRDFAASDPALVPVGTGPYVVADHEPGRQVTLRRDPDYWGADLPLRAGQANLDEIRIQFFGDSGVMFEAFKAGQITLYREDNAEDWDRLYDFPAMRDGAMVKSEITHRRPTGMTGFVMNTRRAPFDDWRVRQAMIAAFNFPYLNGTVTGGRQPRIRSYWDNSGLSDVTGPATGAVRDLLAPFAATLPPGALEGYSLPPGDAAERNRADIRRAGDLLTQAGYPVVAGRRVTPAGVPLRIAALVRQGDSGNQAILDLYRAALDRLGITLDIRAVDNAQYAERERNLDFDLTPFRRDLSLSPGTEQRLYWGAALADTPGTRNLMGATDPAIDAMIDALLTAETPAAFTAAIAALDRVLMAGRYVIPLWAAGPDLIAHDARLRYSAYTPIYGDRHGWLPDTWWQNTP